MPRGSRGLPMFDNLRKIAVNATQLNINVILNEIWADTFVQDFILEELNQDNQLRKGLKANDEIVGFYQDDNYASLKQRVLRSQAPPGVVDLVVSGEFYRTFEVIPTGTGFTITANTSIYDVDFADKYGQEILGLSPNSIEKLREFLVPMIIEKVFEHLCRGL